MAGGAVVGLIFGVSFGLPALLWTICWLVDERPLRKACRWIKNWCIDTHRVRRLKKKDRREKRCSKKNIHTVAKKIKNPHNNATLIMCSCGDGFQGCKESISMDMFNKHVKEKNKQEEIIMRKSKNIKPTKLEIKQEELEILILEERMKTIKAEGELKRNPKTVEAAKAVKPTKLEVLEAQLEETKIQNQINELNREDKADADKKPAKPLTNKELTDKELFNARVRHKKTLLELDLEKQSDLNRIAIKSASNAARSTSWVIDKEEMEMRFKHEIAMKKLDIEMEKAKALSKQTLTEGTCEMLMKKMFTDAAEATRFRDELRVSQDRYDMLMAEREGRAPHEGTMNPRPPYHR